MNYTSLLYGIFLYAIAHIIAFFQLNSQFKWEWFKHHEWVTVLMGIPISFLLIVGARQVVNSLDGLLWPARFIGFGVGMIIYAILVSYFFNESISSKTAVSLLLAITLICVQVLWKN